MSKILFVATNAPGIYKDANSIMLQRLLQYFPNDSYCFLSTSRSEYKIADTSIFTFFKPYLICPDNKIARFSLFKYTIVNLINNIYGIYQIIKNGRDIISKNDISKIVLVSDNGLCIIGGYLLAKLKHVSYFIYLFDVWSDGYLKPLDKIAAKLFESNIFKQATNIFTAGEGIYQHVFKKYKIKGVVINNVYDSSALIDNEHISRDRFNVSSLFKIIYCGSIYWPQIDPLSSLISVLGASNNTVLDLYTNQVAGELCKLSRCFKSSQVNIKPFISVEKLYLTISGYDLAFLPLYNYGGKGKGVINTAQPGKLTDYLISGVPILINTPEDSFISRYSKKYNFAYVDNNKSRESLLETIEYIKKHPEESKIKKRNALETAKTFHNSLKNSELLQEYLLK